MRPRAHGAVLLMLGVLGMVVQGQGGATADHLDVRLMMGRFEFSRALERTEELIQLYPDSLFLYATYAEVAQYAKSLDRAQKFLESRIDYGAGLGQAYFGLGCVLTEQRQYQEGLTNFGRAIECGSAQPIIYEALLVALARERGLGEAISLFRALSQRNLKDQGLRYILGFSLLQSGRYAESLPLLHVGSNAAPESTGAASSVVLAQLMIGNRGEACDVARRALLVARRRGDFRLVQVLLDELAYSSLLDGKYAVCDSLSSESIKIAGKYGYLKGFAVGLLRSADARSHSCRFELSLTLCHRALSVNAYIGDDRLQVDILARSIENLRALLRFGEALEMQHQRLSLLRNLNDSEQFDDALIELAYLYHEIGEDSLSLEYAMVALAKLERARANPYALARSRSAMGLAYSGLGEFAAALEQHKQALAILNAANAFPAARTVTLGNIAEMHLRLNAISTARVVAHQQLQAGIEHTYNSEVANAYNNLGEIETQSGNAGLGLWYYQQALALAVKLDYRPALLTALAGCARGYKRQNDMTGLRSCITRYWHLAKLGDPLNYAFLLRPRCSNEDSWITSEALELAALGGSARDCIVLADLIKLQELGQCGTKAVLSFVKQLPKSVLDSLGGIVRDAGESQTSLKLGSYLTQHSFTLEDHLHSLLRETETQSKAVSLLRKVGARQLMDGTKLIEPSAWVRFVEWAIGNALPDTDEAWIEYVVQSKKTWVSVLRRNERFVFCLQIGEAEIRSRIQTLSPLFGAGDSGYGNLNAMLAGFDEGGLRRLYEELITPVLASIQGCKKLTIVPDGPLVGLPFEMLIRPDQNGKDANPDRSNPHFFVEDYAVLYETSLCHRALRQSSLQRPSEEGLLLVGSQGSEQGFSTSVLPTDGLWQVQDDRSLVGSNAEAARLTEVFPGETRTVDASRTNREELLGAMSSSQVIHIVSHGYWDQSHPVRSNLRFPGRVANMPPLKLAAYEISALNLRADIVFLSACNTLPPPGGKGGKGIAGAFLEAGAMSVVGSSWALNEGSAIEIATSFHSNLATGLDTRDALREAKLHCLRGSSENPYHWAGMVLLGEPIHLKTDQRNGISRVSGWEISGALLLSIVVVLSVGRSESRRGDRKRPG